MAEHKSSVAGKSQRHKFIDAAREAETSDDEAVFERSVRRVATAPARKPKKQAAKRK